MAKTASMLLLLAVGLAALHGATAINQTVNAYSCVGYQFTVALNAYNFTTYMGEYSTAGIPGCDNIYIKCASHALFCLPAFCLYGATCRAQGRIDLMILQSSTKIWTRIAFTVDVQNMRPSLCCVRYHRR